MQQRNPNAAFVGGAWVFPGGKLDEEDSHPQWRDLITDLSEEDAYLVLDLGEAASPHNSDQIHAHEAKIKPAVSALAYWIAALREAFEEAGMLLSTQSLQATKLAQWREQLLAGNLTWRELITAQQIDLDTANMHYLSRWITPPNNTRRYDTRFFITVAPHDQAPSHEDYEAIQTQWLRPEQALEAHAAGEKTLIFPTLMTLKAMCGFDDCHTLLNQVLAQFNPASIQ